MKVLIVGVVLLGGLLVGGALFFSYRQAPPPTNTETGEVWFADVTAQAGLNFVHDAGDLSKYLQPQIHGSGVAVFDFDGDGWLDLYFLTMGGPDSPSINRLYKNMRDGTFKDVTEGSGLGIAGFSTGVAIADVNNDGWPDVLVTQVGGVKLFLNNGNGTFTDVTEEAGLKNPLWASSANFVDYDRDGWLDVVVVNYLDFDPTMKCYTPTTKRDYCGPLQFPGTVTKLFRNLGHTTPSSSASVPGLAGGLQNLWQAGWVAETISRGRNARGVGPPVKFQDVTGSAGLSKAGPGLGVYCADFNGDGWPDIFIANDAKPNHLWINQKDGTFKEDAFLCNLAVDGMGQAQAGMGVAIGDVSATGMFDVYVTHLASERNTLWMQGPKRGLFRDQTARAGLLNSAWRGTGFGTVMRDFNQDGWLDIAVVNGRIAHGSTTPNPAVGKHLKDYCERNQLFRNEGQGKFRDVSPENAPFCGTPNVARGLATGDLKGDGSLDMVMTTVAGPARIFRNVAPSRGHWLLVQARDPRFHRDAYGAEVRIQAGERRFLRIINPGDSYQSSSDPRAHFGLGPAAEYDAIHVLWPDGLAEVFPGGKADQVLVLRRGEGRKETPGAGN